MPTADKSTGQILSELWDLLQTYAKQQTVDPLKTLGRYLGWGIGGAISLGLGVFFVALAGLRGLQEVDWFAEPVGIFEDKTPLVYGIVVVVLVLVTALFGLAGKRAASKERL